MLISFIILTWNSESTICDCLKSISAKCLEANFKYEILLIDNASIDSTKDIVHKFQNFLPITMFELCKNKGTTFSRNIGLRECKGEIICVLDSDTTLINGNLMEIALLLNDLTIGIIAPKLLFADGSIQTSVKRFPSLLSKLLKIPKILFKLKIKNYDFYPTFPFFQTTDVDTAVSACWFFRRSLLDSVGLFDENIFYSPEDIDFCLRVKKANKRIVYFPDFSIIHYGQQITHNNVFSKVSLSHFWGLLYFFYKHKYISSPRF